MIDNSNLRYEKDLFFGYKGPINVLTYGDAKQKSQGKQRFHLVKRRLAISNQAVATVTVLTSEQSCEAHL